MKIFSKKCKKYIDFLLLQVYTINIAREHLQRREIENMEKKKPSLIKGILDYQFPWNKSFAREERRRTELMVAALKGDEKEFWRAWGKY